MNERRKERLRHFTGTAFGKKILCNSFSFYAMSNVENYKDALLQEYSSFIIDYMLHGNPVGAKTWCRIFISLFPFQKKKLWLILIFLQAEGRGTFYVYERMAPPQPPEDSSSQEHLFAPIEACPNWVLGIGSLLFKCPTILQYLFPTCLMAVIAWECSSQGKLFLGPDMAELTAANVHPESGPNPVAPEFKNASFFPPPPFHSLPGWAKVLKEEEVNNFSSSYQHVAKPSYTFHSLSLKSDFWVLPSQSY